MQPQKGAKILHSSLHLGRKVMLPKKPMSRFDLRQQMITATGSIGRSMRQQFDSCTSDATHPSQNYIDYFLKNSTLI